MSKAAANAAAKQHLRRIRRVKSKKDAKAKVEAGGRVGTKGLFVGSMKMKEEYVMVGDSVVEGWKIDIFGIEVGVGTRKNLGVIFLGFHLLENI